MPTWNCSVGSFAVCGDVRVSKTGIIDRQKTYKQYAVSLRKIEDADCIEAIEKEIANGATTSEAFKNLIRKTIGQA